MGFGSSTWLSSKFRVSIVISNYIRLYSWWFGSCIIVVTIIGRSVSDGPAEINFQFYGGSPAFKCIYCSGPLRRLRPTLSVYSSPFYNSVAHLLGLRLFYLLGIGISVRVSVLSG